MFDLNDPWPDYLTGPTKHLHALGVISLNYNLIEGQWADLIGCYAGAETATYLLRGKVADEKRVAHARHFLKLHERYPVVIDHVEQVAVAYTTCAINRNHLMHSRQIVSFKNIDGLSLRKLSKTGAVLDFHLDLPQLRRVADDMMECYEYFETILHYLAMRKDSGAKREAIDRMTETWSWPQKPLSPRKLDQAQTLEAE